MYWWKTNKQSNEIKQCKNKPVCIGNEEFDKEGITNQWRKDNLLVCNVGKIKWRKYIEKNSHYIQKNKTEFLPNNIIYKG